MTVGNTDEKYPIQRDSDTRMYNMYRNKLLGDFKLSFVHLVASISSIVGSAKKDYIDRREVTEENCLEGRAPFQGAIHTQYSPCKSQQDFPYRTIQWEYSIEDVIRVLSREKASRGQHPWKENIHLAEFLFHLHLLARLQMDFHLLVCDTPPRIYL